MRPTYINTKERLTFSALVHAKTADTAPSNWSFLKGLLGANIHFDQPGTAGNWKVETRHSLEANRHCITSQRVRLMNVAGRLCTL